MEVIPNHNPEVGGATFILIFIKEWDGRPYSQPGHAVKGNPVQRGVRDAGPRRSRRRAYAAGGAGAIGKATFERLAEQGIRMN